MTEWFLFLPQVRLGIEDMVERSVAAERSGFTGVAFIDHLVAPMAEEQTIWEAMTLATWVAAKTETLRIGHLVLCDSMRHPAVLAKQAVTLDHASGGRFELGLGWGSFPAELNGFDITDAPPSERVDRMGESLDVIRRLWDEPRAHEGADAPMSRYPMSQYPKPQAGIPLVIGGAGPRTLALAREYADWWNLPAPNLDRLPDLAGRVGSARISVQQMVAPVYGDSSLEQVERVCGRRFGHLGSGLVCGDADALRERFRMLSEQGVERFYVWFADFAPSESIEWFGEHVVRAGL
ncbi:MAG: LLM class flavin-dependent oxidoreductase [Rhodococcus sp. (in: high G+C Gram-positive bacteria)]|uniref:LLM class flavin-dependent oxidoreductase n=1 Tax=Rhodococcus sp. TaxID=1831 RepID=UPI003BB1108D